ncbi:MAG: transcription antitermination factor NusB [Deltaproteobacteria bacterium]|nr:transcription antitermination factor NusB [Deltaproteobacteria bacterium]
MKSRRKAREAALQALYQCDTLGDWSDAAIDLYFSVFQSGQAETDDLGGEDNRAFARMLMLGVLEHRSEIDDHIAGASNRWSMGRMCRVDRNLLRLAAFEIAYLPEIPVSVSINEAIEISKRYGIDDSPMFINGVLDNLASTWVAPGKSASLEAVAELPKKLAVG